MLITGDYNRVQYSSITGMSDAALTDQATGAYSLMLDGSDNLVVQDCFIGSYTIARGNSTNYLYEIKIDSGVSAVLIDRCTICTKVKTGITAYAFAVATVDVSAVGMGGVTFRDTGFRFPSDNNGVTNGSVFRFIGGTVTGGRVYIVGNSYSSGATTWDAAATASAQLQMNAILSAGTGGLCLAST
jgi:hypothetical protein